jgi:hypothetical protein
LFKRVYHTFLFPATVIALQFLGAEVEFVEIHPATLVEWNLSGYLKRLNNAKELRSFVPQLFFDITMKDSCV